MGIGTKAAAPDGRKAGAAVCVSISHIWGGLEMKQRKTMNTERTQLFTPGAVILMKADICGKVQESETLSERVKQAVYQAACANETLMSRLIMDETGEVRYEKMEKPQYQFTVLPEGTDWKRIIKEQERIPYDLIRGELIRYFLIPSSNGVQFFFMAHHLAGDGKSMLVLLEDIMKAMNGETLEYKELFILEREDFPQRSRPSWRKRRHLAHLNRQWEKVKQIFKEADYREMFETYWKSRETEIEDIVFSREDTAKIVAQCKAYGVTVNSYLTAAILKAYEGDWTEIGYAVDVRNENNKGMGNFASGQAFETMYVSECGFKENTWQIDAAYHKQRREERGKYFSLYFLDMIEKTFLDSACMQIYTGYDSEPSKKLAHLMGYDESRKELSISNLTRINLGKEKDLYRMENLLFVAPVVPYGIRLFGIVTLDGKLGMTLHYNKGDFNGEEYFKQIVAAVREDIEEENFTQSSNK